MKEHMDSPDDGNGQPAPPTNPYAYGDVTLKENPIYNAGFHKRIVKSTGTGVDAANPRIPTIRVISIPLNRYAVIESFRDSICPPGKLMIELDFWRTYLLYRNGAGNTERMVVTNVELSIPVMRFNDIGLKLYLNMLKEIKKWSFLREYMFSQPQTTRDSSWVIDVTVLPDPYK